MSLAEQLGKLACLLAHCSQPRCSSDAANEYLATIPSCLSIVSRLLEGPGDEVTNDVRRRVFTGFSRVITHHSRNQSLDELDGVIHVIFRGLTDRDRSARLSAG